MVDITCEGKEPFEGIGDVRFDLLRRHAGVKRYDYDDWNLDFGKQVHGHAGDGCDPYDRDHETQH